MSSLHLNKVGNLEAVCIDWNKDTSRKLIRCQILGKKVYPLQKLSHNSQTMLNLIRSKQTPFFQRKGVITSTKVSCAVLDVAESSAEKQLTAVWTAEQGIREEMEDEIHVVQNVPGGGVFLGVFDGHAGQYTAQFLKSELYSECLKELEGGELLNKDLGESENFSLVSEALTRAFEGLDSRLLAWQEERLDSEEGNSGSTATVVFVKGDQVVVANAGDCRAVLCSGGESIELCGDHRPAGDSSSALSEIARIKSAGGWISGGRVCGYLAVSRAFGDPMYKTQRKQMLVNGVKRGKYAKRFVDKLKLDEEWVIATPEVNTIKLTDEAEFILVGSDGLWDSVKSSEAVTFVKNQLEKHNDAQEACNLLVQFAIKDRKGDDNVTVGFVDLR